MLPLPGELTRRISPPSSREISRLIASPSPVPPYLRLVLPSACWNASKMICCLSGEMPMPVSETEMASTGRARLRSSFSGFQPLCAGSTRQRDPPLVRELERVGEQVLDHLLEPLRVGVDGPGQVAAASRSTNSTPFDSATWRNVRST